MCNPTQHKLENMKNEPNNTHTLYTEASKKIHLFLRQGARERIWTNQPIRSFLPCRMPKPLLASKKRVYGSFHPNLRKVDAMKNLLNKKKTAMLYISQRKRVVVVVQTRQTLDLPYLHQNRRGDGFKAQNSTANWVCKHKGLFKVVTKYHTSLTKKNSTNHRNAAAAASLATISQWYPPPR